MDKRIKNKIAQRKIASANNVLLISHGKPDGDAVSSLCAMMVYLSSLDKKCSAYTTGPIPAQLGFLPKAEKIVTKRDSIDFNEFDLIIVLDCGSLPRTNMVKEIRHRRKDQYVIEFDHHPKIDDYSDLEIRTSEASSTTEVLYYFFRDNLIKIDKQIANCILTGILTDTGNFLYPSTTDRTINIASEMLLKGAKYPLITEETWRNKSLGAMKLWGRAIGSLEINKKYGIAYAILTSKDFAECDCSDEEVEGVSGFLSNLYGVNGLILLREGEDGYIKGSLRTSSAQVDISKLAHKLGGGGHKKASGFMLKARVRRENNRWIVE